MAKAPRGLAAFRKKMRPGLFFTFTTVLFACATVYAAPQLVLADDAPDAAPEEQAQGSLVSVSHGGSEIHDGGIVSRSELSDVSQSWTFNYTWPQRVTSANGIVAVFRGTFGSIGDGNDPQDGVDYSLIRTGWGSGTDFIQENITLPALGLRSTDSGTYTVIMAESGDLAGFLLWFTSGGTQGTPPDSYSTLVFNYDATDYPEDVSGEFHSLTYRGVQITPDEELYRDDLPQLDTSPNDLDHFWEADFDWPESVSNNHALLMLFRGTFGSVEGGSPVPNDTFSLTSEGWNTNNDFGKYFTLPALKDDSTTASDYTLFIAERDPKYTPLSGEVIPPEALWFASGGTDPDAVPPLRYALLTFHFKGDRPPPCCDSVMFLPGITGSRLYRPGSVGIESWLWEPRFNASLSQLALNSDGTSVNDDIYTKVGDVIDDIYKPLGFSLGAMYSPFLEEMRTLESEGTIASFEAVPYDWRLSFDDVLTNGAEVDGHISYLTATDTPYITQELENLAANSKTGKVTIVAHSMGGLLAKELLRRLGDEAPQLVDRLIMVGSPQVGTPKDIASMLHGYGESIGNGWILSPEMARSLSANFPSAYALLPSEAYFTSVSDPVMSFSAAFSDEVAAFGDSISDYGHLFDFLENSEGRIVPGANDLESASVLNGTLLNQAKSLHDGIDAWTPPSGIEVDQIAGWGLDTVSGISYDLTKRYYCPPDVGNSLIAYGYTICVGPEPKPVFTSDGDGTVVVPSALYMSTSSLGVNRYWINLLDYNQSNNASVEHSTLFSASPLLEFLSNLLEGEKKLSDFIVETPPSPIQNHLQFRLHSPLSLDVYDSLGRHTGIASSTADIGDIQRIEEQIPNSYYIELGDTKYIGVSGDGDITLVMNGYDTGTFDLDIDEFQGDEVRSSTTFAGVPVSPQTIATVSLNESLMNVSNLEIDSDGDGVTDITLAPEIGSTVTYSAPQEENNTTPEEPKPISSRGGGGGNGAAIQLPESLPLPMSTVASSSVAIVAIQDQTVAVVSSTTSPEVESIATSSMNVISVEQKAETNRFPDAIAVQGEVKGVFTEKVVTPHHRVYTFMGMSMRGFLILSSLLLIIFPI